MDHSPVDALPPPPPAGRIPAANPRRIVAHAGDTGLRPEAHHRHGRGDGASAHPFRLREDVWR